jgi:hypothetical protein
VILLLVFGFLNSSGGCDSSLGGRYATHGVVVIGVVVGVLVCFCGIVSSSDNADTVVTIISKSRLLYCS